MYFLYSEYYEYYLLNKNMMCSTVLIHHVETKVYYSVKYLQGIGFITHGKKELYSNIYK